MSGGCQRPSHFYRWAMKPIQVTITKIAEDLFVVTSQDKSQILSRVEITGNRVRSVIDKAMGKLVPINE